MRLGPSWWSQLTGEYKRKESSLLSAPPPPSPCVHTKKGHGREEWEGRKEERSPQEPHWPELDLGLLPSRMVRHKYLLFKPPVYAILLRQPEQTNTYTEQTSVVTGLDIGSCQFGWNRLDRLKHTRWSTHCHIKSEAAGTDCWCWKASRKRSWISKTPSFSMTPRDLGPLATHSWILGKSVMGRITKICIFQE